MPVSIRELGRPGDLGWVVMANGEIYAREYDWDASYEQLVAGIVGDFARCRDPDREQAWIAELDGERVGTVFCVADQDTRNARLRILLVEPETRGHGVGRALVHTCVGFARDAGYPGVVLWTNTVLTAARRIYESFGFNLVEEDSHHSFGHDLVGQTWRLRL
ncbi:MAG: GNAT family N-acetyltransferase [Nocardia sp.]|nr:GNAT family N-acetyltransferase [Nocardia sp.]